MRPTRAIGPVLGISLVLLAGACSDAEENPAAGSATDPATQPTESTDSGTPTAAPVDPVDFGEEPALKVKYARAALRATKDGLITMVPSANDDALEVLGGGYSPDPQWWRMEFTKDGSSIVLDQFPGTAESVLAGQTDLVAGAGVNLSRWGTGEWSVWDHQGATVMAYDLKGSTVILQGPNVETVSSLAQTLLPAEDGGEQDG